VLKLSCSPFFVWCRLQLQLFATLTSCNRKLLFWVLRTLYRRKARAGSLCLCGPPPTAEGCQWEFDKCCSLTESEPAAIVRGVLRIRSLVKMCVEEEWKNKRPCVAWRASYLGECGSGDGLCPSNGL
jgi:hypothetical protein